MIWNIIKKIENRIFESPPAPPQAKSHPISFSEEGRIREGEESFLSAYIWGYALLVMHQCYQDNNTMLL